MVLLLSLGAVALAIFLARVWYRGTMGKCTSEARIDGKTVIVTGANTGIGKETAKDLAQRGARVILACRDLQRAHQAKDEIIEFAGNKNVEVMKLDLSSLTSVRDFVKEFLQREKRLDVLINNAAATALANRLSEDGLQQQMQINHYGPFLLTILLLDILKKSAPSRIINVSSVMHKYAAVDLDDLNCEKSFPGNTKLYSNAKLFNVLFANELARRLEATGVTANSLHPGAVNTEIFRRMPNYQLLIMKYTLGFIFKDAKDGAQTSIHLAVSDEVQGVTGKYFVDCKEAKASSDAQNRELAKELWDKCAGFVKLTSSELNLVGGK